MKTRFMLLVSLGLNLGLFGVMLFLLHGGTGPPAGEIPVRQVTNLVREIITETVSPAPHPAPAPRLRFHWSQLESPSYRTYMANLREVGCPEATLREIILADVNEHFAQRRKSLLDAARNEFWTSMMWRNRPMTRATEGRLKSLRDERRLLLRDLLGENWERAEARAAGNLDPDLDLLAFLPASKRDRVLALRDRFRIEGKDYRQNPAFLSQLEDVLSTDELDEFKLRTARFAQIARGLRGVEFSPEELRQLARVQLAGEERAAIDNRRVALVARRRIPDLDTAQKQIEQQIKMLMGDSRFEAYQRALDPDFRLAYDVSRRYQLPAADAVKLYDLQQSAEAQAQAVRADTAFSDEERQAALDAIRSATDRAAREAVGDPAARTFRKYSGTIGPWDHGTIGP